jgi:hypothetical protein
MEMMPPAYSDGAQIALLRKRLEAMENGGTVVISSRSIRRAARPRLTSAPA